MYLQPYHDAKNEKRGCLQWQEKRNIKCDNWYIHSLVFVFEIEYRSKSIQIQLRLYKRQKYVVNVNINM